MDNQTKTIIAAITENLGPVTEKQALVLHLLTAKPPEILNDERNKLRVSAQVNEQNAQAWRQS